MRTFGKGQRREGWFVLIYATDRDTYLNPIKSSSVSANSRRLSSFLQAVSRHRSGFLDAPHHAPVANQVVAHQGVIVVAAQSHREFLRCLGLALKASRRPSSSKGRGTEQSPCGTSRGMAPVEGCAVGAGLGSGEDFGRHRRVLPGKELWPRLGPRFEELGQQA